MEGTVLHFLYRQFWLHPPPNNVDLTGQVGIVTGSNVGLGFEACRQLLAHGLHYLIMGVRDEQKGNEAREELLKVAPHASIEVWTLDLASYDSVLAFCKRAESLTRLDLALLNAGVFNTEFETAPETGHEVTIQVNYLSTALLSILLLRTLKVTVGSKRLTIVSSDTHEWASFKEQKQENILAALDDKEYFSLDRYFTSKLLQVLFVQELVAHISDEVLVNIVNPGLCAGSSLHRNTKGGFAAAMEVMKRMTARTAEVGARVLVNAAVVQRSESHGKYISDSRITRLAFQSDAAVEVNNC